jgi:ribosomal protein S18 acetylase RimI-like enzyme
MANPAEPCTRRPYAPGGLDSLVDFCLTHPTTSHPPDLVRRLIGKLPADDDAVLDVWQDGRRRLVGVVLDTLDNTDQAAVFDVLGWDGAAVPDSFWGDVFDWAERRVLAGPRRIVSVACSDKTAALTPWLMARGYEPGFTIYGMATEPMTPPPAPAMPTGWRWLPLGPETVRAYYDAVCAAMGSVPGTNIAAYADFAPMALQASVLPSLLLDGDTVAGFFRITLAQDAADSGYILALGRLPAHRGQGLGPILLQTAMARLQDKGARRFTLDVAATNASALSLYERHGFRIVGEEPHYLRHLDGLRSV